MAFVAAERLVPLSSTLLYSSRQSDSWELHVSPVRPGASQAHFSSGPLSIHLENEEAFFPSWSLRALLD